MRNKKDDITKNATDDQLSNNSKKNKNKKLLLLAGALLLVNVPFLTTITTAVGLSFNSNSMDSSRIDNILNSNTSNNIIFNPFEKENISVNPNINEEVRDSNQPISQITESNYLEFVSATISENKKSDDAKSNTETFYKLTNENSKLKGVNVEDNSILIELIQGNGPGKVFKVDFPNDSFKKFNLDELKVGWEQSENAASMNPIPNKRELDGILNNDNNINVNVFKNILGVNFTLTDQSQDLQSFKMKPLMLSDATLSKDLFLNVKVTATFDIPAATIEDPNKMTQLEKSFNVSLDLTQLDTTKDLFVKKAPTIENAEVYNSIMLGNHFSNITTNLNEFYNLDSSSINNSEEISKYITQTSTPITLKEFLESNNIFNTILEPTDNVNQYYKVSIIKPTLQDLLDGDGYLATKYLDKLKENKLPVKIGIFNTRIKDLQLFNYDVTVTPSQSTSWRIKALNSSSNDRFLGVNDFNSNSWRIPGINKTQDGTLIFHTDKRLANDEDFSEIDQISRVSKDGGATWSDPQNIIKIVAKNTNEGKNKGMAIDGSMVEAIDPVTKQKKLIILFGVSNYRHVVINEGTWRDDWVTSGFVNNGKWMVFFDKDRINTKLVAKPIVVDGRNEWWKIYEVQNSQNIKWENINDNTPMTSAGIVVDNSYKNGYVTGDVYAGIPNDIFDNFGEPGRNSTSPQISKYLTQYSVWDQRYDSSTPVKRGYIKREERFKDLRSSFKYSFDAILFTYKLESTDGGQTWGNFENISPQLGRKWEKFLINGVGSGIQLKNQRSSSKNGRIIIPFYHWDGRWENHQLTQKSTLVISDDMGKTFRKVNNSQVPGVYSSESSINEDSQGNLWWLRRSSVGRNTFILFKSSNGGDSWTRVFEGPAANISNNQFIGSTIVKSSAGEWLLFGAPTLQGADRTNGKLFMIDLKNPTRITKLADINNPNISFSYSTTITTNENPIFFDILLFYETHRAGGVDKTTSIQLRKFRVFTI
ncbi:sialidase family protein [Mycoplasma corogypsi]|uniref:sialidase family protein n=1 Tax=Mycoplasma corogypsi TaxID=2106 RepID=UPI00387317AC